MITTLSTRLRSLRRPLLVSRNAACGLAALALSASVIASPPLKHGAGANQAAAPHRWLQIGRASWYGRAFQGKRTATGERFDMNALTCAHRTLPLGSWLRVTNLGNHRFTFVRVNDRGPYEANTIVDLSYAAAQKLALIGKAAVRVEQVRPDDPELAEALVQQLSPDATLPAIPISQ